MMGSPGSEETPDLMKPKRGKRPKSRKPQTPTQRPHSSSFLGLPYRTLYMNPKKELL